MKKLMLSAIGFATILLSFTACEKDSLDSQENIITNRAPLSIDLGTTGSGKVLNTTLPQNIQELRNEGISVSNGLASFVRSIDNLLAAAELSISNPDRLRELRFFESEIVELRIINRRYNDLVAIINLGNLVNSSETPITVLPTTIEEARNAGIPISIEAERIGDLQTLLTISLNTLDVNDRIELDRLRSLFRAIEEDIAGSNPDPDPDPMPDPTLSAANLAFIAEFDIPQDVIDLIQSKILPNSASQLDDRLTFMRNVELGVINSASTATFLGNDLYSVQTNNSQGTQTFFVERTLQTISNGIRFSVFRNSGLSGSDRTPSLEAVLDRIAAAYTQTFVDSVQ